MTTSSATGDLKDSSGASASGSASAPESRREPDGIYQKEKLVARAVGAEVDTKAQKVRFAELYRSDPLSLPDECEYGKYRILVDAVGDATKHDHSLPDRGRILRGVTADILSFGEQ